MQGGGLQLVGRHIQEGGGVGGGGDSQKFKTDIHRIDKHFKKIITSNIKALSFPFLYFCPCVA